MELIIDKGFYTDFVIYHRMKRSNVYTLWEGAGDLLNDRGYPIHAFMMYTAVCLMRMETRPMDKNNCITIKKANELAKTINSNENGQKGVYAFKKILKKCKFENCTKLSLFLHALISKATSSYFILNGLCFNTAMDCEIFYLNQIFEMGLFNNNKEWLICNILNLVLNALDVSNGARRLKEAKHLLHVARAIMSRCDRNQGKHQFLYELYELCKCAYWGIKMETNMNEISNRFVCFNLTSMGIQINDSSEIDVSPIQSEKDYIEIYKKIRALSDVLNRATNEEITNIFNEILRNCKDKFVFL